MPLFSVQLKGSGHIIPILANNFSFGDETAKLDGNQTAIRVLRFEGFHGIDGDAFLRTAGEVPASTAFRTMGGSADFPDYYFIKESAVAAIHTRGSPGVFSNPSVAIGTMHAWLIFLEHTGRPNGSNESIPGSWEYENLPVTPLILAKQFRIGPLLNHNVASGQSVQPSAPRQASVQIGIKWEDYLGYTTFGRLNSAPPMLYEAESASLSYYFPLSSVAAIVPVSADITDLQPD